MRTTVRAALTATLFAGTALGMAAISRAEEPASTPRPVSPQQVVQPMSDDRFWALIQAATAYENDPDRQLAALRAGLAPLSVEEVEQFESTFDAQLQRSYSWDLWGAAYLVHGGASDDEFEYFRCWLISKGRAVFEKVRVDPDSLADLLAPNTQGVLQFEPFAYVARKVWGEKVGRPAREMPNATPMMYFRAPAGTKFAEDAASLARRYSKLWRRFGSHPLQ
jgi:hypothetical protein